MKIPLQRHRRIVYPDSGTDRRVLSMYLQASQYRKKSGLQDMDSPIKRRRLVIYGLFGIFFGIGLFFVFF